LSIRKMAPDSSAGRTAVPPIPPDATSIAPLASQMKPRGLGTPLAASVTAVASVAATGVAAGALVGVPGGGVATCARSGACRPQSMRTMVSGPRKLRTMRRGIVILHPTTSVWPRCIRIRSTGWVMPFLASNRRHQGYILAELMYERVYQVLSEQLLRIVLVRARARAKLLERIHLPACSKKERSR
jgi:hypothetical protein